MNDFSTHLFVNMLLLVMAIIMIGVGSNFSIAFGLAGLAVFMKGKQ